MRKLLAILGALLATALVLVLVQGIAAESGEVVVVRTRDAAGAWHETRLWIVEDAGTSWLRAGTAEAGWLARVEADPDIEVVRGGETRARRGLPEPARRERIDALMRRKYGWADAYISFLVGRGGSVPVRLADPAD